MANQKRRPPARRRPAKRRRGRRSPAMVQLVAAGAVLAIVVGVLLALVAGRGSSNPSPTASGSSTPPAVSAATRAQAAACTTDEQMDPGRNHVLNPQYSVDPPAGGDHLPEPAAAGVYSGSEVPADGNLVHSLEHGYVILWYRPSDAPSQVESVKEIAGQYPIDTLVVPRGSLPEPVALTAWGHRLLCQGVNFSAMTTFITTWRNQGPEKIPHS